MYEAHKDSWDMTAAQMQLKVLFRKKSHGRPDF